MPVHDFPKEHETHGHYERTDLSPAWTAGEGGPRAREVTIGELDRRASQVVHRVSRDGEVAVITRHGLPVAMVLPLNDAVTLLPAEYVLKGELRALADQIAIRLRRRFLCALMHARTERGRWPWPRPGG